MQKSGFRLGHNDIMKLHDIYFCDILNLHNFKTTAASTIQKKYAMETKMNEIFSTKPIVRYFYDNYDGSLRCRTKLNFTYFYE